MEKAMFEKKVNAAKLDTSKPEAPKPSGKNHGRGSSNGTYYKIEVCTIYPEPTILPIDQPPGHFVIDNHWREWPIRLGGKPFAANIPVRQWDGHAAEYGMLSYIVAQSHRWALLAFLEANPGLHALCIKTRLVKIEFHEMHTTEETGVSDAVGYPRHIEGFKSRSEADATPLADD